jgi:hypothetical protein
MRKYRLFTKPARVADVIQEDLNSDISGNWQEKTEKLQHKRWQKVRMHRQLFSRKEAPTRRRGSWRNNLGHLMET